jgi:hypothetical protein
VFRRCLRSDGCNSFFRVVFWSGGVCLYKLYKQLAGSPAKNLETLWDRISQYYSDFKVQSRYSVIKMSMFTNPKQPKKNMPCLKGKASEVRHLGPALLEACNSYLNAADPLEAQVLAGMQMSVRMEEILDEHAQAWKLPTEAATEFLDCTYNFLSLFTSLANSYQKPPLSLKLFNVTIKCHYLLHSALMSKFLNPRLIWCYSAEDYMHKIKILGQSCVKGSPAWQVSNKVADKWMLGFACRLSRKPKL